MTFEEWWKTQPIPREHRIAARAAWHARDAEIAKLRERAERAEKVVEAARRWANTPNLSFDEILDALREYDAGRVN